MAFRIIFLAALAVFLASAFVTGWLSNVGAFLGSSGGSFWSHIPLILQIGVIGFLIALMVFVINVFSGNR